MNSPLYVSVVLPFEAAQRKHGVRLGVCMLRLSSLSARLRAAIGMSGLFLMAACASTDGYSGGAIPSVEPSYSGPLAGATPRQVEAQLGRPAIVRDEGQGALWTYRFADCALMVGFTGPIASRRVTDIDSGPRRSGQSAPSREACLESAKR